MNANTRTTLAAAAAFALAAFATAAAHAADTPVHAVSVSYKDLDINKEADARVLLGRIRTAARRVCGPPLDRKSLREYALVRQCTNEATLRAVAAIDRPALTAVHAGRSRDVRTAAGSY